MTGPAIAFDSSCSQTWASVFTPRLEQAIVGDSLDKLAELEGASRSRRMAGFFNYDLGRAFEVLPARAVDDLQLPMVAFAPSPATPGEGWDEGSASPESCVPSKQNPHPALSRSTGRGFPASATANFSRDEYESAVQKCLDYIAAGDVFQINLSQRFSLPVAEPAWAIYQRLQSAYPADFGAFLDFGSFQLLSNSPELFLRVTKLPDGRRKIVNRPIKGTRPNQPGMLDALRRSEKDMAELAMIVDLQRNDLGRICEIGSVVVTQSREIETHPTVLHGVATIEGILRPEISLTDILRATFPCGSVTGCPKIRAMQIIDELEPVRRGAYCGAIGWIENGQMELSVAIRTMTIKDGVAHIPVGGGIVADSDPAAEYEETLVKAQAMFGAVVC